MIFVTGATGMVGANLIALFERNNVIDQGIRYGSRAFQGIFLNERGQADI